MTRPDPEQEARDRAARLAAGLTAAAFLAVNSMFILFNLGYPGLVLGALLPAIGLGGWLTWRLARTVHPLASVVAGFLAMYLIMGLSIVAVTSVF